MAAQFRIRPTQRTSPGPCTKAGAERDSPATIRSAGRLGLAKYALPVLRHALRGARMQLVDAR